MMPAAHGAPARNQPAHSRHAGQLPSPLGDKPTVSAHGGQVAAGAQAQQGQIGGGGDGGQDLAVDHVAQKGAAGNPARDRFDPAAHQTALAAGSVAGVDVGCPVVGEVGFGVAVCAGGVVEGLGCEVCVWWCGAAAFA